MRLVQFEHRGHPGIGRLTGDQVIVPLRSPAGMSTDEAVIALAMGDIAAEQSGPELDPAGVTLAAPVRRPPSIRDFMLYEQHLANSLRPYGREVPPAWYREPSFYFTCPHTVLGPGAELTPPRSDQLDYELELAVVIGRRLHNASRAQALAAIAGYALFNDFSLRDVQAAERPIGLGPMKSKDFASALGPTLVTRDEIDGDLARPALSVSATVNGQQWSQGRTETMHFDLAEAIVHAARDSVVMPGDVLATGTIPTGCVLELVALGRAGPHRWLLPGDEIVLSAEQLGSLVTIITQPARQSPNLAEGNPDGL